MAVSLQGSRRDWLGFRVRGRHAAGVLGPKDWPGGAGAERRGARSAVWCFGLAFFFSAKEVCFGHASRRPPPPAPSPAPPRTPLGADCKAPSLERAADSATARLAHLAEAAPSVPWIPRVQKGTGKRERERERDRRFPALITSPPRLHGLPGPFLVARFCAEDCTSPSLLGSAAFRILEACKLGSPAPGQNLQRNLWSASLGPAGRRSLLHEPVSLRAGARRWRGP